MCNQKQLRKRITLIICILVLLFAIPLDEVWADGDDTLGPPLDLAVDGGSGIVVAGTGLSIQPGLININVPPTADVNQVLLYWAGADSGTDPAPAQDTILVDGIPVEGKLIGEVARNPVIDKVGASYRADITGLGLVVPGPNALTVSGLDFFPDNDGAGVLVIFDDSSGAADIQLRDGHDFAFQTDSFGPGDSRLTTVPQSFNFASSGSPRTAELALFVASVEEPRETSAEITVGGITTVFSNLFSDADGDEWDTVLLPVNIPAGVNLLTVQLFSRDDDPSTGPNNPASIVWVGAGLSLLPSDLPCGECEGKVSQLTLKYLGSTDNAQIEVFGRRGPQRNTPLFDGIVDPNEMFTFSGPPGPNPGFDGTLGTDIYLYVNGVLNTSIHTSCSQPIGPGLVRGDFEVIEGYSKHGGLLCPLADLD